MSDPRFYWSPDPDGSLEVIDLGEGLTDFQELPALVRRDDSYTGSMLPSCSFQGGSRLYRITLERFGTAGSSALERKLLNGRKEKLLALAADPAATQAERATARRRANEIS